MAPKKPATKRRAVSVDVVESLKLVRNDLLGLMQSRNVFRDEIAKITEWLARVEGQLNTCQTRMEKFTKDLNEFAALKNAESSRRQMAEQALAPYKRAMGDIKKLLSEAYNEVNRLGA